MIQTLHGSQMKKIQCIEINMQKIEGKWDNTLSIPYAPEEKLSTQKLTAQ